MGCRNQLCNERTAVQHEHLHRRVLRNCDNDCFDKPSWVPTREVTS
jgi:hypothetical protein